MLLKTPSVVIKTLELVVHVLLLQQLIGEEGEEATLESKESPQLLQLTLRRQLSRWERTRLLRIMIPRMSRNWCQSGRDTWETSFQKISTQ
jgi:hypothetical protein